MPRISATIVSLYNGDITIDAEALAPKLGLTAGALKENMANGLVTSVAETGTNDDAGRTRLTFRFRARVWRVVIDADGTLTEAPVPPVKPATARDRFNLFDSTRGAS
ncbi:MAG: hypothetical protein ACI9JL_004249 [Paracoccaceae bacterium]|jgi:predicted ArsR family transcriptional regulator